jgi:PBP1b-binding outer membrane lipoprotein LpoB
MNRTNPLIAVLLFAFLLGGCTSYRNLAAPPKADVEGAVRD